MRDDSEVEEASSTMPILLGFYGPSNSGKTTLFEAIIPRLEDEGMRVATIKQTHHDVTADAEGKDTWRHRRAGADPASLSSDVETALFLGRKLSLDDTVKLITSVNAVDVILIEGWKQESVPKVFLGGGEELPDTLLHYRGDVEEVISLIHQMIDDKAK
ncbi:MAG: molybdopterin-guanine dinucleotide biosynthesis protein B [Euryarchaeota archaeon]|jgi:molybdopterin-guanine dinucleotide biosynthesis protein B|nr:molybdopterin-guanine dinucleotide biosynthesis protein B [Euryarchaeota archaeon]